MHMRKGIVLVVCLVFVACLFTSFATVCRAENCMEQCGKGVVSICKGVCEVFCWGAGALENTLETRKLSGPKSACAPAAEKKA